MVIESKGRSVHGSTRAQKIMTIAHFYLPNLFSNRSTSQSATDEMPVYA